MITTEKKLDETDKKILNLISEGKTVKEIAWKVGKSSRHIDYRLKVMRKYYQCANIPQLIVKLQNELA